MGRKRPWLCKNNHALLRSPTGKRICLLCSRYVRRHKGKPFVKCLNGHGKPVGINSCHTCDDWRQTPWHKELDIHGRAVCPKGHEVTHDTLLYTTGHRRRCHQCVLEWSAAGVAGHAANNYAGLKKHGTNGLCAAGKHPWGDDTWFTRVVKGVERQQCKQCRRDYFNNRNWQIKIAAEMEKPLEPHHIDWVVVQRLITEGSYELSKLRRGQSYGPTAGERWVAYCTWKTHHDGREPSNDYDTTVAVPERAVANWGAKGRRLGFVTEVDFYQLLGSIGDKAYLDGTLLYGGPAPNASD